MKRLNSFQFMYQKFLKYFFQNYFSIVLVSLKVFNIFHINLAIFLNTKIKLTFFCLLDLFNNNKFQIKKMTIGSNGGVKFYFVSE